MGTEHWACASIGQVFSTTSGGTPNRSKKSYYTGQIPWFKSGELNDAILRDSEEHITAAGIEDSSAKLFPEGTVLIALYGATIGKMGILSSPGATNQAICAIYRSPFVENYFLFWFLFCQRERLIKQAFGAAQPNISQQIIRELPFPLPPLGEQKRIVEKLDAILPRVKGARARLEKIPGILKKFRQSVLAAACSGRLTEDWREGKDLEGSRIRDGLLNEHANATRRGNAAEPTEGVHDLETESIPDSWQVLELEKLCESGRPITYGILKPGPDMPGGIPYIRVADFPGNVLNPANIRRTTPAIHKEFKRSIMREGDLLLSIRGTVGRIIIIPGSLDGANITQDSARLSIHSSMNAKFVYYCLLSPHVHARMQRAIKGVAIKGINIGDVRALQVPIPDYPEQNEIVARVEKLFALAESLEAKFKKAMEHVERIEQAVLAKAFRGELAEADPNDEPAEELLKRILAEKEKLESGKKGQKGPANKKRPATYRR